MKIAVTGSSGLIGSALTSFLKDAGHQITRIVRKQTSLSDNEVVWDPMTGQIDRSKLEGFDAFINLAGESIAEGRWTEEKKRRIRDSRIKSTETLRDCILKLKSPPRVLISGSAIGYYGNQNDRWLTESSPKGSGFLAQVCQEWEEAAKGASAAGSRVTFLRTGVVLSPDQGALKKMLLPFQLGLGGEIGSGKQYMSWISITDIVGVIAFLLRENTIEGPVNAVSPNPVTNHDFTKTLGKVLKRPTFFTMPAFAAKLVFGEMADEMLLSSQRVEPKRLNESHYLFKHTHLENTLKELLKLS